MIRATLQRSQLATFALAITTGESGHHPLPAGSAFLVSPDGLVVTAAHILDAGTPRVLLKEPRPGGDTVFDVTDVLHVDADLDLAILRVAVSDALERVGSLTYLQPSARELDDGEPVYACGYPLTVPQKPYALGNEELMMLREAGIDLPPLPAGAVPTLMNHQLSPRVTSAAVSSQVEYYAMFDTTGINERRPSYVLDKALNYGNSGGPVVAAETGYVHAWCCRFQPMLVPQMLSPEDGADKQQVVMVPSLYGIVARLSYEPVRSALENAGAEFASD